MWSLANRTGRLVELKMITPIDLAELGELKAKLLSIFAAMKDKAVIATDLHNARELNSQEVFDGLAALMRTDNPRVLKSAFWLGPSVLFSLQIERLIREAANPARQTFQDKAKLVAWLSEALAPAEIKRLEQFLAEP